MCANVTPTMPSSTAVHEDDRNVNSAITTTNCFLASIDAVAGGLLGFVSDCLDYFRAVSVTHRYL